MGELRSQGLTIARWIINLPLATVGHRGGLAISRTGPGSRGLFLRESRRIKVKVKLINQRETEESCSGLWGEGEEAGGAGSTKMMRAHEKTESDSNQHLINRSNNTNLLLPHADS